MKWPCRFSSWHQVSLLSKKFKGGGYKGEIFKRMRTLLLPYGFWILMFLLFDMILTRQFIMPSFGAIGLNPFGCPALSPLWYVRALICLVLISPVILLGLRKSPEATLLVMLFLYGAICPYYPMPQWGRLEDLVRVGPIPVLGLFYFTVGMAIRLGSLRGIIEKAMNFSPIIWIVLGFALVITRAVVVDDGLGLLGAYCGFASIPFLIFGFFRMVPAKRGPNWLVLSPFPVYVIHKFFYPIVGRCVDKNTLQGYVLSFVCVFVLSLLATCIIRSSSPKISAFVFGGR